MRILLFLVAMVLTACTKTPDETAIRQAIDAMQGAVEKRQPKSVLSHLAPEFHGPEGMDRRGIRQLMAYHFFRNQKIKVWLAGMKIVVVAADATVSVRVAVTGGNQLLPERAQYYQVVSEWRKIGGDWLVVGARWEPVLSPNSSVEAY